LLLHFAHHPCLLLLPLLQLLLLLQLLQTGE
jgi:hypothetical protein